MKLTQRIQQYFYLMRFDKPIGIQLLLWPTLWALWLASHGVPDYKIFIIFLSGVILMRAAGCVLNDLADRDVDPFVKRTSKRPLASGQINIIEALIIAGALLVMAFSLVFIL